MSIRIQELAVPKGKFVPLCELCRQKGTTKCESCKYTYYCGDYHKEVDLKSFHKSVCQLIAYVRREHPVAFSEADRIAVNNDLLKKKQTIQQLAEVTARKWLLKGNVELAYPAAMNALNFAKDLVPLNDIKLIYPTCLVAETYLRLDDIKNAQEGMVLASWVSQTHDVIPPNVCAKLKRLVGLVCMSIGKWKEAREAFAECVYATAIEHGTSSICMTNPYGLLGLSLLRFDNQDGAMSSFHIMADKWMNYLLVQYNNKTLRCASEEEILVDETVRELEFQCMESKTVFKLAYDAVRRLGVNAVTDLINFKILCVQALQRLRDGDPDKAVVYKHEALATATRTKQDKAVTKEKVPVLIDVLGDDYLMLWERKHNRPRTIATKYLEMIKEIDI